MPHRGGAGTEVGDPPAARQRQPASSRTHAAAFAIPPRPDAAAGSPAGDDPIRRIIDHLFPEDPVSHAAHAAMLERQLIDRITACRDNLLADRLGHLPAEQRLALSADGTACRLVLDRLLPEMDHATALALLAAGKEPVSTGADRFVGADAALREASLDALFSGRPLIRLDRHCRRLWISVLLETLDISTLPSDWRPAIRLALLAADTERDRPVPQHRHADEALLLDALNAGDTRTAIRVLAAAALVPVASIEAAIALRNRRGLVSLAWKAGYSMHAATRLQSQIGGIPPDQVLVALPDGSCPLTRNEILWQVGFLAQPIS